MTALGEVRDLLSLVLAVVLLATAVQSFVSGRRLRKVAAASEEIHVLVNSRLTLALEQNESLLRQNAVLIKRLAALEAEEEGKP